MKNTNIKGVKTLKNIKSGSKAYQTLKKGFLKTALLCGLPFSIALAEDNGFYMGVGYQIGGTQQEVNNKGSTLRKNVIDGFRQVGVGIAGDNGLLSVATNTMMDALMGIGGKIVSSSAGGTETKLTKFRELYPQIKARFEADQNVYTIQGLQQYLNDLLASLVGATATGGESSGSNSQVGSYMPYKSTIDTLKQAQGQLNLLVTGSVDLLNALTRVNVNSNSLFLKGLLAHMQNFNTTALARLNEVANSLANGGDSALQQDVKIINDKIATYQQNLKQLGGMLDRYNEPYLPQFGPGNSSQHGVSNGVGFQMGYKQFFGSKRNVGLRYYAFFDYGYTQLGNLNDAIKANIFTYGAGTDFLWNMFRKVFNNQSLHVGLFGGIQLAGTTWDSSLKNQVQALFKESPTSTNFQFLFNLGLRAHFARTMHHRFLSASQSIQHGVEFGVKIPTINQSYLKADGADVSYRRLYAFYFNYTIGF
ncbi:outer membrane protein [Helicobacter cetorum]|uniref:Outer membrane protein HopG n=1 Tax=Helicobacter cetorum (strain ATCC BAA-540 / CCUG 52418 / MIT 99-5656) TaxID=1163745 RepID=I0ERG5_HELCM|nr:outer membrane protein [Helicobacter cetorum]AFI05534.1 hypothetical protein HCD_02580 [Helicobacter cetorum MIT 99-5656]